MTREDTIVFHTKRHNTTICEASIEFHPHGDVFVPSSGMNPDVTAAQYRNKGIRDNGVLVSVSREVLNVIPFFIMHEVDCIKTPGHVILRDPLIQILSPLY